MLSKIMTMYDATMHDLNDVGASCVPERFRPMDAFDYKAAAELFPRRKRVAKRQPLSYTRFTEAAQAIRFAMEELAPEYLVGAVLEVDERRYGSDDIRRLYESREYPLARRGKPQ